MNKYEFISNKINILFKKLFNLKNHPFYLDLEHVDDLNKQYNNYKKNKIKKQIKYNKVNDKIEGIAIDNSSLKKEFDINILKLLSIEMAKSNNFKKIVNLVNKLYYMDIPSNIRNVEKYMNHIKKSEKINIMIVGAGPVGLFLACYLFNYYNKSFGLNNYPKVNIIILDNRIVEPGIRKPYTRHRPFAFNSGFFSQIIPRIYGWDGRNPNILFMNIYILEYVLFTKAYYEYAIPFIFEDIKWDDIKSYIKKGNIDVMFDCTGGNLNPPIFKDVNTEWLDKMNIKSKNFPKLKVENNIVTLEVNKDDNKFPENYYYGSIVIFKKKINDINYRGKLDIEITNKNDYNLINKYKYKYFQIESIKKIIKGIESDLLRNYLYNEIEKYSDEYIFKIEYFNTDLKHALEVSRVITIDNHKCVYIGAGDTIFHSHFITGAGLNRTINFVAKCANFIMLLSLID